jgi:hypothetical protein
MKRNMRRFVAAVFVVLCAVSPFIQLTVTTLAQEKKPLSKTKDTIPVSFSKDVLPLFNMYCLPCHTEDEMNPSRLYLDSYEGLLAGGKHGSPVRPGHPDSSLLLQKMSLQPPFGDPMPLKRKTALSSDTVDVLKNWILQGASKN